MPRSTDRPVLVIHGVGAPPAGDTVRETVSGINTHLQNPDWQSGKLELGGHVYAFESRTAQDGPSHVYEVNWSDLKHRPSSPLGVFVYAVNILLAMVQAAASGWRPDSKGASGRLALGPIYRFYFSAFLIPSPFIATMLAAAYCIEESRPGMATFVVSLIAAGGLLFTWALQGKEALVRWAMPIVAIVSAMAIICIWLKAYKALQSTFIAAEFVGLGAGALIALCILETLARFIVFGRSETVTTFLVRTATFILPNALYLGGVGALSLGVLLFAPASIGLHPERYNELHGGGGYNLFYLELINGGVTALLGLYLVAIGVAWYVRSQSSKWEELHTGALLRRRLAIFLGILPIGLLIVVALTIDAILPELSNSFDAPIKNTLKPFIDPLITRITGESPDNFNPAHVYAWSAARLLPWLGALIGPLRGLTAFAADVLFYVLPPRYPLSINNAAKARFQGIYDHLSKSQTPVVAAHSQGSVIAADVLAASNNADRSLVTFGSPIGCLYRDFLSIPVPSFKGSWSNLFRESDPIGGKISGASDAVLHDNYPSTHVYYFRERRVAEKILELV